MPVDGQNADGAQPGYAPPRAVQLPPISYQPGSAVPNQYQAPAGAAVQQLQDYPAQQQHMQQQYSGYPASPYGAPTMQYSQRYYSPPLVFPIVEHVLTQMLDNQTNPAPKYEH